MITFNQGLHVIISYLGMKYIYLKRLNKIGAMEYYTKNEANSKIWFVHFVLEVIEHISNKDCKISFNKEYS